MTVEHFNSVGGYSVGIPPTEVIDADGNVITPSVTANTVTANIVNSPKFVGDLHGTLYGNVVGTVSSQAVASVSYNEPSTAGLAMGSLWFDPVENTMKVYYGNGISRAWVPVVLKQTIDRYSFDESIRWVVNHNKNTTQFRETLLDSSGNRFIARVNIIDANSFEVLLTESVSGYVDVIFG